MEEAKESEYEEKRAAFHSARAAVKLLRSKVCAWKIKDNISTLRLGVKGKLDDAVLRLVGSNRGHERAEVRKDESVEQSEQGDEGVTPQAQGVARGHWCA